MTMFEEIHNVTRLEGEILHVQKRDDFTGQNEMIQIKIITRKLSKKIRENLLSNNYNIL